MTDSKRPVRLIVCDIDDTLLPVGHERISDVNMQAIAEARDAGIIVSLATGRHYMTAVDRVREVGANDVPVIASNGADVRVGGRTVHAAPIRDEAVARIVRAYVDRGVRRYLFCDDEILCLPDDVDEKLFGMWASEAGGVSPVRVLPSEADLLSAARGRTQKILAWVPTEEQHEEIMRYTQETFGEDVDAAVGGPLNIEMSAQGVSKANGLRVVCSMLDVPMDQTMAIGDSGNDAEMLRVAGIGVAVGNAMEVAREAADIVVEDSEHDGVAHAIRRYALGTEGDSSDNSPG